MWRVSHCGIGSCFSTSTGYLFMCTLVTAHLPWMYMQSDDGFSYFNFAVESLITPNQQTDCWLLGVTCTPALTHTTEACGEEGQKLKCVVSRVRSLVAPLQTLLTEPWRGCRGWDPSVFTVCAATEHCLKPRSCLEELGACLLLHHLGSSFV